MINNFRGQFGFLSNMHDSIIIYQDITYMNAEAAFQSMKTLNIAIRKTFTDLSGPKAKRKGKSVKLRKDWNDVREEIMYEIVKAKFIQNPLLLRKLLATGNELLEEGNIWGDKFWGTVNGIGENKLGLILMMIRDELRNYFKNGVAYE